MVVCSNQDSEYASCVFVINGDSAAVPILDNSNPDNITLESWSPLVVGNPQLIQAEEYDYTWFLETTAAGLNSLIGQRVV